MPWEDLRSEIVAEMYGYYDEVDAAHPVVAEWMAFSLHRQREYEKKSRAKKPGVRRFEHRRAKTPKVICGKPFPPYRGRNPICTLWPNHPGKCLRQ